MLKRYCWKSVGGNLYFAKQSSVKVRQTPSMKFYFIGICGVAMGNAAILLDRLGHSVSGVDSGTYPPMSELLKEAGIETFEGYDDDRLEDLKPDSVVVGNTISRGNPEVEWLLESRRFPILSLPALLQQYVLKDRFNIVIAGTHGKTTTTALTTFLLRENGSRAGYFVGGVPRDLPVGAEMGDGGAPFVIEGDEYDSAFFDKRSKFVHYAPSIVVINNLEFDHCDIFRDLGDVQRSFSHLLRLVPRSGHILLNGDDRNIRALLPVEWTRVVTVGMGEECDLQISDFEDRGGKSSFVLKWKGTDWTALSMSQGGLFNARNAAMAALAAGLALYPDEPTRIDLSPVRRFSGVKRRQEILFADERTTVFEDFGHHPTAIGQTLAYLRSRYRRNELIACFEPRSNTSKRSIFQVEFADALGIADRVLIGPVHRAAQIPEKERLNTAHLAGVLEGRGVSADAFDENRGLLERLLHQLRLDEGESRVVCFFTNGSFDGIMKELVAALSHHRRGVFRNTKSD